MANELMFEGYVVERGFDHPIPFEFYVDDQVKCWNFYINEDLADDLRDQDDFFKLYGDKWYKTIEDFKRGNAESMSDKFKELNVGFTAYWGEDDMGR